METNNSSMERIVDQIEKTVSNLNLKRNLLTNQKDLYDDLQAKMDMRAEKVMVLLGDGYFVEQTPEEAKKFLCRRIANINQLIVDFNDKIKEAESTIDNITKFIGLESTHKDKENSNEEGLPFIDIEEELDDNDNITSIKINNEEHKFIPPVIDEGESGKEDLPLMDIQEELDDNDNIKSVKINNKEHKLESSELTNKRNGRENEKKKGDLPLMDIREELDDNNNIKSAKVNNDEIEINNSIEKRVTEENLNSSKQDEQNENQISELLEDMGLTLSKNTKYSNIDQEELLDKIDQLKITPDEKFTLKQICVEGYKDMEDNNGSKKPDNIKDMTNEETISQIIVENNLQEILDSKSNTSTEGKPNRLLVIDGNDLLELELIADQFDDTNNSVLYDQDEEWDFEFEDDDEEDDGDDISDELLYGDQKTTFIPQAKSRDEGRDLNNLLWKQIMDLRNQTTQNIDSSKDRPKKKSVRFSEKLEINEIENISDELKKIDHFKQNISRFKQNRLTNSSKADMGEVIKSMQSPSKYDLEYEDKTDGYIGDVTQREDPVGDIVERENPVGDIVEKENPVGDIVERENPVGDIVERENPVGDIVERENPVGDIVERENPVGDIVERENPVGDIVERENPVGDIVERENPIGDIVERENPVGDIVERENPVGDIVERENPVGDIVERENPVGDIVARENPIGDIAKGETASDIPKPRVSKFKQTKAKQVPQAQKDHSTANRNIKPFEISDIEKGKTRKEVIEESINETEDTSLPVMDATLDYRSMQDDLDTMAKAYNLGMYDDDILTEGPVVQELDDFNTLNKIIESMPTKTPATKSVKPPNAAAQDQFDPYLDQIGVDDHIDDDDEDDDEPVLTDILENDIVPPPDIEQSVLAQEVTANYHKLRQKLLFKSDPQKNSEYEPIDEDGNNLRISRFKASRYNNQRHV